MDEIKNMATRHLSFRLNQARELGACEVKINIEPAEDLVDTVAVMEEKLRNSTAIIISLEAKHADDLREIAMQDARIEKVEIRVPELWDDLFTLKPYVEFLEARIKQLEEK